MKTFHQKCFHDKPCCDINKSPITFDRKEPLVYCLLKPGGNNNKAELRFVLNNLWHLKLLLTFEIQDSWASRIPGPATAMFRIAILQAALRRQQFHCYERKKGDMATDLSWPKFRSEAQLHRQRCCRIQTLTGAALKPLQTPPPPPPLA